MSAKVQMLTRKDLRNLAVVGGGMEAIDWFLYDTLTISAAGPLTSYRFFQQATGNNGVSLEKTNMEIAGQLPAGYKMVAQKITARPRASALTKAAVNDQWLVSHKGRAQFFIGTRPYLQCSVQDLLGGAFTGFAAGFDAGTSFAYAAPRTIINGEMEYSPVVPANFSFSVLVEYDTAPAVAANIDLEVKIVGKLIRPKQG